MQVNAFAWVTRGEIAAKCYEMLRDIIFGWSRTVLQRNDLQHPVLNHSLGILTDMRNVAKTSRPKRRVRPGSAQSYSSGLLCQRPCASRTPTALNVIPHAFQCLINRHTYLLEIAVSHRKQCTVTNSNRNKNGVFPAAIFHSNCFIRFELARSNPSKSVVPQAASRAMMDSYPAPNYSRR